MTLMEKNNQTRKAKVEDHFEKECNKYSFNCKNGQCVDIDTRCDREYDCNDGSDEFDCGKIVF